jgi:hypothetical protein
MRKPCLDVLAGWAGVIAGWKKIDVLGATRSQRTRTSAVAREIRALCQVFGFHNWGQ